MLKERLAFRFFSIALEEIKIIHQENKIFSIKKIANSGRIKKFQKSIF
jgi:hypothetical protein